MKNKIRDRNGTIITNTMVDPHHGGVNEWGLYKKEFYHRLVGTITWTRVNKMSLTIARVKMLNTLIERNK